MPSPPKVIAIGNVERILENVEDKTLVVFTLDSLLEQNETTLVFKNRDPGVSRGIDRLQRRGIRVLLLARLHPLRYSLGQGIIDLLKSYGYDFGKSWIGFKDYRFVLRGFADPLFVKGGLFFEQQSESDYWDGIERFIRYLKINVEKVVLVHESGVAAVEEYHYKKNPLGSIDAEYVVAEN
jgi:hypothetical protein